MAPKKPAKRAAAHGRSSRHYARRLPHAAALLTTTISLMRRPQHTSRASASNFANGGIRRRDVAPWRPACYFINASCRQPAYRATAGLTARNDVALAASFIDEWPPRRRLSTARYRLSMMMITWAVTILVTSRQSSPAILQSLLIPSQWVQKGLARHRGSFFQ